MKPATCQKMLALVHLVMTILVMKGQVLVKPTSEILLADTMVPAVRGEVRVIKMLLLGNVM